MTDDSHCKYFYTTSTVYLRKKRSNDIKFAWQPNPVGGALTGTDQCGFLVETQELWESAGWFIVVDEAHEGVVADRWLIRGRCSEYLGSAPGQESLMPDTWPLNFPWSRNRTLVSGCLATRCKALSGRGGVAGARRWTRGQAAGWTGRGLVWCWSTVFFLPNIVVQHQPLVSK